MVKALEVLYLFFLEGIGRIWKLNMFEKMLGEFPSRVRMLNGFEVVSFYCWKTLKWTLEGPGGLACLTNLWMFECEVLEEFPFRVTTFRALEKLSF